LQGRSKDWSAKLENILEHAPGVGEIGLDRRDKAPEEAEQEEVFCIQMDIAARKKLAVTIHCVRAWGWMHDVLQKIKHLPDRMLFHSYAGPVDFIKILSAQGGYFSFNGVVLDSKHRRSREAIHAVPKDRLLLETDSPDLIAPVPYRLYAKPINERFTRNEPANLECIYKGVAQLLGIDQNKLEKQIFENTKSFLAGVNLDER